MTLARERHHAILAGPVELVAGWPRADPAHTRVYPDWPRGALLGTVSIVAHIDGLLRTSDSPAIRPAIRGGCDALGAHGEMVDGDASVFASQPLMDIEVPGGSWQLAAVPQHGWHYIRCMIRFIFILGLPSACCWRCWLARAPEHGRQPAPTTACCKTKCKSAAG